LVAPAVFILSRETQPMTGIQFVTDAKGRKLAVQIDLKRSERTS
jgi:hypothetical protein